MGTHNHTYNFNEQFQFSGKPKTWSLIGIIAGVAAIAFGFLSGSAERTFANLLLMSYYFACICAAGHGLRSSASAAAKPSGVSGYL